MSTTDAPASSRLEWERHPNAHGAAGMMLRIHDGFRRASEALVIEADRPTPDRRRIRAVFDELAYVLHHHHHAEEVLLFPRLAEAGVGPDALVADHRSLTSAIASVDEALRNGADVSAPLHELDVVLRTHLDVEESVAIPYLLDHPRL
jgi:hemerythrin-like domain-containing protein